MKKGWTTTKLMASGSLAVLDVILELMASVITLVTGIAMASGVLTIFIRPLLVVNCLLLVDGFGAAFIFMIINSILTLPLALSGPPGFLPKIPILVGLGLIQDLLYLILKRYNRQIAALVIGGVDAVYSAFAVILVGRLLNVPGIDKVATFLPLPLFIAVLFSMGAIGGYLGYLVYQKIKGTAVVRRIQG